MTRTVWTRDEKRQIFENAQAICLTNPRIGNKALLIEAQQVLPMDRRIKVTDQRVFSYKDRLNAARADAELMLRNVPPPVAEEPAPQEEPRKLDTLGQVFELFVDALADRIISKMIAAKQEHEKQNVSEVAGRRLSELFGSDPMEDLDRVFDSLYPEKKRKTTALIIGLNGHQMQCVKEYWAQARKVVDLPDLDIKFLSAEDALSHTVSVRDHTFLMTKFINHSVQNKYRKHPNLHYCNGGVSELKTLMHGIFKEAV